MSDPYTRSPKIDITDAPQVTLARRQWYIPEMALRQTTRLAAMLPQWKQFGAGAEANGSEEHFEALTKFVHIGLTRAYPDMSYDDFLDLPVGMAEIAAAMPVITEQMGVKSDPGEAKAASQPTG